jgi:TolB-like protein
MAAGSVRPVERRRRGVMVMTAMGQFPACARKVLALGSLIAVALVWMSISQVSAAVSDRAVEALAGEIARGLDGADLSAFPASSGYTQPTIAIRAFTEAVGPVDAAEANYVNDRLLIALQRQTRDRFRFVARDAVGDLIADIDATTEPSAARDARLRDLQVNLRADILIRGTIRQTERGAVLTYQAVASETGALLVAATPVVISAPARAPVADARIIQDPPVSPISRVRTNEHPTVLEAEELLLDLGYDPGPVDGVLSDQTRAALRAYQRDSALPVNGRMTWSVVENMRRDTR